MLPQSSMYCFRSFSRYSKTSVSDFSVCTMSCNVTNIINSNKCSRTVIMIDLFHLIHRRIGPVEWIQWNALKKGGKETVFVNILAFSMKIFRFQVKMSKKNQFFGQILTLEPEYLTNFDRKPQLLTNIDIKKTKFGPKT